MKKRIGIDCRLAGIEHAGIGRYTEELVRRVIQFNQFDYVLFLHHENQLVDLPVRENVKLVYAPIRHYTVEEQIQMPGIFSREHLDLLHVPHFNIPLLYPGKYVITIHDLLWHEQQGSHVTTLSPLFYAVKYQAYRYATAQAVRKADHIVVPAQTVKDTIVQHYSDIDPTRITVTNEGVDAHWFKKNHKPKTNEKILFYTGSLYPHKNVLFTVQALAQLSEYKLYISSSRSVFTQEFLSKVKEMGMEERVTHLGRLSDEELLEWYGKSTALIQPSLSEGFGLTGVEAMAAGLSVLASDIPIFKEIYKNYATYFNPKDVNSFVTAVRNLEKNPKELSKAIAYVRGFSWDTMTTQTIDVYSGALSYGLE